MEVLGPEVDRLLIGAHEVVGHLPERRRPESMHVKRQALDPADDQQRAIFNVVIGMMMRDEDRLQCVEWNAGARELIGDAHAAIKHVCRAVAQHHVGRHFARAAGHGTGGGTEQHQLGALCILERGLRLLRRPARSDGLRKALLRCGSDDWGGRQPGQQAAA